MNGHTYAHLYSCLKELVFIHGGGSGEIIFTLAPGELDIDNFNANPHFYEENDIYYLEVCILNEMCRNYAEMWTKKREDSFFCKFDAKRWANASKAMRALG